MHAGAALDLLPAFDVNQSWGGAPGLLSGARCLEEAMGTGKAKVLVIDDDADFRASITAVLEAEGYQVSGAASAHEGLERIGSEPPDLIVLDIIMEYDSAGYEVNHAVKFREEYLAERNVPILMVSSIQLDPFTLYGRATEVDLITPDAYLTKPLDIPVFLEKVRTLIAAGQHPVASAG